MLGTPLGVLLSLVGLLVDKRKSAAIAGLVVGGGILVLYFTLALCS